MVGFINIAVHNYQNINIDIVKNNIVKAIIVERVARRVSSDGKQE